VSKEFNRKELLSLLSSVLDYLDDGKKKKTSVTSSSLNNKKVRIPRISIVQTICNKTTEKKRGSLSKIVFCT